MIESLKSLFLTYGFKAASIIVLTVIIVNLIKKPVLKKFSELAAQCGYDKSIVTKNFTYLPVCVAFLLDFAAEIISVRFNFYRLDFANIFSSAVLYGALSISLYETVKIHLKAYAEKSKKDEEIKRDSSSDDSR